MRWLRLPSSTNDGGAAHVSARWPPFVQQTDFVIYKQTAETRKPGWCGAHWH